MAFSSVHEMIDLCKESGKPLYEVILESDLAESGLTRAESEAEMHRLWFWWCDGSDQDIAPIVPSWACGMWAYLLVDEPIDWMVALRMPGWRVIV